jgi:hypothetical protein
LRAIWSICIPIVYLIAMGTGYTILILVKNMKH